MTASDAPLTEDVLAFMMRLGRFTLLGFHEALFRAQLAALRKRAARQSARTTTSRFRGCVADLIALDESTASHMVSDRSDDRDLRARR